MRYASYACFSYLLVFLVTGCITKKAPTGEAIREQALDGLALPGAWKAGTAGDTNAPADHWLAGFEDEVLLALVYEAQTNNLDLAVAATRVSQAAGYVDLAKAALRPGISILGTGGLKGLGGGDMSSGLVGGMLAISWEIDLWGRLRYARNAAKESYAAVAADFFYARQSLAASVAKGWFMAAEVERQLKLTEEVAKAAEEIVRIAEQRAKVGVGSEQDVALARGNLGTAQDSLAQLRLAQGNARRALELLLGRYPGAELKTRDTLPELPGPIPVGMPLRMLERRPDLVAAERRVAAAFNRVREAKAARLPTLALNGSVAHLDSDVIELKEDFENPTAGAGGRIVAPIYTGGGLKTQVKIRTIEQETAVAEYARMALRAITDVENSLAASQTLSEREQILNQVVAENVRALELAEQSYRVGAQDLRSVLQQQVAVQNARMVLLRVQSEQLSQRVSLHLALGGGFAPADGEFGAIP